jgi:hypothetical protein
MIKQLLLGLFVWQAGVQAKMGYDSASTYKRAVRVAAESGKPILVVGGPYGAGISGKVFGFKAHGCGDICLDIDPVSCHGCPYTYGDIREIPFPDGYFGSAFASHVLEHLATVDDAYKACEELYRVANNVFICAPGKDSIYARLISDHHLWIRQVGDTVQIEPMR